MVVAFPIGNAACEDPTTGVGGATVDGLTGIAFCAASPVGTGGAGPSATTMKGEDALGEAFDEDAGEAPGAGASTLSPASDGCAAWARVAATVEAEDAATTVGAAGTAATLVPFLVPSTVT